MLNKQAIIGLTAGIIILLGAGGVFLLNKNKTTTQPNNTTSTANENTNGNSMMSGSIQDIFAGGKNQKCEFDVKSENVGETKGTVYVADTKAYGEFGMITNGKTTTTHLIRNADTFYIWGDSLPTGMKMTMNVNEMASKMPGNTQAKSFDPNQKYDYKCTGWAADASKFIPPTNIKFTDLGSIKTPTVTTNPTTGNQTGTSSQCSVCNALTGDSKTACLSSLHCQ